MKEKSMVPYKILTVDFGYYLYDNTVRYSISIESYPAEHACSRYVDGENGLEVDENTPIPQTPNGMLYRVGATSGVDFPTIEAAKAWANAQPWGPVSWNSEKTE